MKPNPIIPSPPPVTLSDGERDWGGGGLTASGGTMTGNTSITTATTTAPRLFAVIRGNSRPK